MPDKTHRFKNSWRMVVGILVCAVLLQAWAIQVMGKDAAVILTTSIPAMLALAAIYAKVTNDAETKEPK